MDPPVALVKVVGWFLRVGEEVELLSILALRDFVARLVAVLVRMRKVEHPERRLRLLVRLERGQGVLPCKRNAIEVLATAKILDVPHHTFHDPVLLVQLDASVEGALIESIVEGGVVLHEELVVLVDDRREVVVLQ